MQLTQRELNELIEKRLRKVQRQRWRQLEQLVKDNATLTAEFERLRNRTFIDRLIDLFRPSRSSRFVAVNSLSGVSTNETDRPARPLPHR